MTDIEDRSYALGRMEGKLDLLLSLHNSWKADTAAAIECLANDGKSRASRISAIEAWQTKITTVLWSIGSIITLLWTITKFIAPYFFK